MQAISLWMQAMSLWMQAISLWMQVIPPWMQADVGQLCCVNGAASSDFEAICWARTKGITTKQAHVQESQF